MKKFLLGKNFAWYNLFFCIGYMIGKAFSGDIFWCFLWAVLCGLWTYNLARRY